MKTIAKIFIAISFLCSGIVNAQEFKYEIKNAKKIDISELTGDIKIVGQSGTSIQIETDKLNELPERAKGLRPISGGGVDNTNVGLNITETGSVVYIKGATRQSSDASYTFKVPNDIAIRVDYSSPFTSGDVIVEDFGGEFEMTGLNDGARLKNVTGPVFIELINGNIEIVFTSVSQKSPMSIQTINGEIDLTLPSTTKANLELNTLHGDIFTDLDIEIEKKKEEESGLTFLGGSVDTKGKLNGGGVRLEISSINGNIYLRKK